jgi:hypothetical protein
MAAMILNSALIGGLSRRGGLTLRGAATPGDPAVTRGAVRSAARRDGSGRRFAHLFVERPPHLTRPDIPCPHQRPDDLRLASG